MGLHKNLGTLTGQFPSLIWLLPSVSAAGPFLLESLPVSLGVGTQHWYIGLRFVHFA